MSFLANRNVRIFNSTMSVSTLNTSAMAISTLTGSTMNASSINVSTLSGSTLTASTMTGNQITISTLTVSSINNGAPGVAAYSTFNASSLNATSTMTTSTLTTTGFVGIGTATPQAPLHVYKAGGGIGNTLQGEIRVCSDDNQISRIGCYEEPNGTTWGGFFQYNGGGTDLIQIGGKSSGVDQYYMAIQRISGNVGIGTVTPGYGLDVNGTARITGSLSFSSTGTQTLSNGTCGIIGGFVPFIHCSSDLLIGWSTAPSGNSYNDVNNNAYMGISLRGSGNASSVMCATNYIPFVATKYGNSGGNMMIFGYSAAVGTNSSTIGTITHTTSSVSYNTTSDARLKENIEDVSNIRDMIDHLRPRTFTFISDDDKDLQVGFIAQEVREYYPHYVSGTETEKDFLGMDYGKMSPFAIAACKDLYLKNDMLTAQVIAQTTTINSLEAQVATLLGWARAQGFSG